MGGVIKLVLECTWSFFKGVSHATVCCLIVLVIMYILFAGSALGADSIVTRDATLMDSRYPAAGSSILPYEPIFLDNIYSGGDNTTSVIRMLEDCSELRERLLDIFDKRIKELEQRYIDIVLKIELQYMDILRAATVAETIMKEDKQ